MVLVGHCTLKDCAVADSAAPPMSTEANRNLPTPFLDMCLLFSPTTGNATDPDPRSPNPIRTYAQPWFASLSPNKVRHEIVRMGAITFIMCRFPFSCRLALDEFECSLADILGTWSSCSRLLLTVEN